VDPAVENWPRSAEYDLAAAEHALVGGHTLFVVIACQQAAEKALKAAVTRSTGLHPPKTHNLEQLAGRCALDLPDRFRTLLDWLNQSFMAARYPLDLDAACAALSTDTVHPYLSQTKELVAWVRSRLTSAT
jgi:HEPN domain-containing protein